MIRDLNQFKDQVYDLLVVGGGINGSAIAHLASLRGYKVALVEKNDFASGTSSKSSKLMHGGLRYLENFEFSLVKEALRERTFHARKMPHLVKPLEFLVPVYKKDQRPLWMFHAGVFLYDLLAGKHGLGKHRRLSRSRLIEMEPNLKKEGLKGGVSYFDAQMDDVRLCIENLQCASSHGAHLANYAEVVNFIKENGKVIGANVKDNLTAHKNVLEIRAKKVILATGVWSDQVARLSYADAKQKVRATKGVHLVTERKIFNHAMLIPSKQDRRIFFVLPWHDQTMIGTTDTDYFSNPDQVKVKEEDVEYLMDETNRVYQGDSLKFNDIQASFAGLRPLVVQQGSESKVSREHVLFQEASGIYAIVGGKYTTYRVIAKECVDKVLGVQKSKIEKLFSRSLTIEEITKIAKQFDLDEALVTEMNSRYGDKTQDILKLTVEQPDLLQAVSQNALCIKAEIVYACKQEMAQKADDVVHRRISIAYSPRDLLHYGHSLHCLSEKYMISNSLS